MKVAIIGMGVIGRAQARMFSGHDLVTYDIADGTPYPADRVGECDFAVICTGTPPGEAGRADLSQVTGAFTQLPGWVPVLIRSTVPPGTTDRFQESRPDVPVCCAPEFLHEREGGAWRDSTDVPFLILGGSDGSRDFFIPFLAKVFPGTVYGCAAVTAELAKYTDNLYWATRVTFVNEMAAICRAVGGDWETVRQAWLQDPRVTDTYTAYEGLPPGFGGRCWPKDLDALIAASRDAGYEPWFLSGIRDANERFRAK